MYHFFTISIHHLTYTDAMASIARRKVAFSAMEERTKRGQVGWVRSQMEKWKQSKIINCDISHGRI